MLDKANERVNTLTLKCQERSIENEKLKIEHADAIREKADLLTAHQRHISEMERVGQAHAN